MPHIEIFDSEYITVEYWPEKKLIYHTIHKPTVGQDAILKAALDAGSDVLTTQQFSKWLSDDRKNGPLSPEFLEWSLQEWQPRTINAGWKYWANVVPQDLAAAGTLMPVIDNLFKHGLRMMVFTTIEDAMAWLDNITD